MSTKKLATFLAIVSLSLSVGQLLSLGDGTTAQAQPMDGAAMVCREPGLPIGVNQSMATDDFLDVADGGVLCDLDVYLDVNHTWVGDLEFRLRKVGGVGPVPIINRPGVPASTFGCGNDDYDVTVNDEGPDGDIETQCDAGPPAINGNRVGGDPAGAVLSQFDGENFAGQWLLSIADHAAGDMGTLNQWCLLPTFCLDHFMCYELRRQPRFAGRTGVSLKDQFGPSTVDVRDRKRLCNPADKNGEGLTNPVDHLVAYTIRQTDPDFDTIRDIRIVNQFGEIEVDLARPDYLLVPSLKAHLDARGNGLFHTDHYKCYDLRRGRTRATVTTTDQFGELTVNVKRPERLCVPVDKNGEGILRPDDHLTCYRVKTDPRRLPVDTPFQIFNQFEQETVVVTGPRELCVPSLKILPGEPTPTPTPEPTATQTPEPTPTQTPSCGFLTEEPGGERAVQQCGGPCPTDQQCLFQDGACRCASVSEACQLVPPQTMPSVPGMCLGLCDDASEICVPFVDGCTCMPVQPPCTSAQFPTCLGDCPPGLTCGPGDVACMCFGD